MRKNPILRNIKLRGILFGILGIYMAINIAFGSETEVPKPKDDEFTTTEFEQGYILYEDICESWILIPGMALWNRGLLAFIYFVALLYVFLGVSIISDLFMGSIEEITSQTRSVRVLGDDGVFVERTLAVWNPTIANLSLMALGSSAPEILLSVIETVGTLGSKPGELGPSTIVGSAAFNLLVISGVSILCVEDGIKKIDDVGVFAVTTTSSMFAYLWLLIILVGSSPDEISMWEAIVTFLFFFVLLGLSYTADRWRARMKRREAAAAKRDAENVEGGEGTIQEEGEKKALKTEDFYHVLRMEQAKARGEAVDSNVVSLNIFVANAFGTSNLANVTDKQISNLSKNQSVVGERLKFRSNVAKVMSGRNKPLLKMSTLKKEEDLPRDTNELCGFKCLQYSVLENMGKVIVEVVRSVHSGMKEFSVGIRTVDYKEGIAATAGEDYISIDQALEFKKDETIKRVPITIVDDEEVEDDENFIVELYCLTTGIKLDGDDTKCIVTIIDDDKAGILEFDKKTIQVAHRTKKEFIKVIRRDGCLGTVTIRWKTEQMKDDTGAKPGEDYTDASGVLTFEEGETEKMIPIEIKEKNDLTRDDLFKIVLSEPTNHAELGKKGICVIHIITSDEYRKTVERLEKILMLKEEENKLTWGGQVKRSVMLSSSVDEEGNVDDVTAGEALLHFLTIGWKVAFSLVPPPRYGGGWPAFFIALCYIGMITAVVGEFAGLLGCAIGMSVGVTAITFVAMGTSLPDTFASKQAAEESDYADAAIGNVTGSNSVNVFLGLGLPYVIACAYYASQGDTYEMPAGDLAFSVIVFLVCSALCVILLIIRRNVVGGELGGGSTGKYVSATFCFFLWVIFIVLVSLKFESENQIMEYVISRSESEEELSQPPTPKPKRKSRKRKVPEMSISEREQAVGKVERKGLKKRKICSVDTRGNDSIAIIQKDRAKFTLKEIIREKEYGIPMPQEKNIPPQQTIIKEIVVKENEPKVEGLQLKLVNGIVVIDEKSKSFEYSNAGLEDNKKSSQTKYKPKIRTHCAKWTPQQTKQYEKAIAVFGTDFTFMEQNIFPNRTRKQLKNKYNKESKLDVTKYNNLFKNIDKLTITDYEREFGKIASLHSHSENESAPEPDDIITTATLSKDNHILRKNSSEKSKNLSDLDNEIEETDNIYIIK